MNSRRMIMMSVMGLGLIAAWAAAKQAPTPPPVIIKNEQGEQTQLYQKSYALLIGVSDYANWRDLPGVKDDIAAVKAALWQHGFEVATVENPTGAADEFREFHQKIRPRLRQPNRHLFCRTRRDADLRGRARDGLCRAGRRAESVEGSSRIRGCRTRHEDHRNLRQSDSLETRAVRLRLLLFRLGLLRDPRRRAARDFV